MSVQVGGWTHRLSGGRMKFASISARRSRRSNPSCLPRILLVYPSPSPFLTPFGLWVIVTTEPNDLAGTGRGPFMKSYRKLFWTLALFGLVLDLVSKYAI